MFSLVFMGIYLETKRIKGRNKMDQLQPAYVLFFARE